MLDGVDPDVIDELTHAVHHVPKVEDVTDVRARWLGHRLHAEVSIAVKPELTVAEAHAVALEVHHQLLHHVPHLADATIHVDPANAAGDRHHRIMAHAHDNLPVHSH
jgi:divalent metal cation (Fe/Co/Zn/Cd) transporter